MKKQSRRKKLAFLFLIAILLSPLVNFTLRTVGGNIGNAIWDGSHHITIAIDNGDLSIWSIEPSEKRVREIIIPKNTYLTIPSYGPYRAEAVGKFSLLEKKDGTLLKDAIASSLGIPIDATVIRKNDTSSTIDPRTFVGVAGFLPLLRTNFGQSNRTTNLTLLDILRLWIASSNIAKESITRINVSDLDATAKTQLPDGTEGLTVASDRFAKYAPSYFTDKTIKDEDLSVEILNGTTVEGKANTLATLLTNIGATVINTAKSDKSDQTVVTTARKSYTAEKIAKITEGKLIIEAPKEGRADILVILGEK